MPSGTIRKPLFSHVLPPVWVVNGGSPTGFIGFDGVAVTKPAEPAVQFPDRVRPVAFGLAVLKKSGDEKASGFRCDSFQVGGDAVQDFRRDVGKRQVCGL